MQGLLRKTLHRPWEPFLELLLLRVKDVLLPLGVVEVRSEHGVGLRHAGFILLLQVLLENSGLEKRHGVKVGSPAGWRGFSVEHSVDQGKDQV